MSIFYHAIKAIVKDTVNQSVHIICYNMSAKERNLLKRSICNKKESKQPQNGLDRN